MSVKYTSFLRASLLPLALMLAFTCTTQRAHADITQWETSEGGRMRVVSLPADGNGKIEAVLQIDLKPGWITYWREPGEAGIPPQLTMDAGSGASLTSLSFPVPDLIENGEIQDIGYKTSVSLPFTLQAEPGREDETVRLTAFIGVCLNICIPFEANFEIHKGKTAMSEETDALQAAKSTLPEPASDDFRVQNFHITPDKTLLGVELHLPEDAPKETEIFVAGPSGYAYFEPQNLVRDKRKLSFYMNIKGLPKSYNPKGQSWTILVKSAQRAMEAPLDFPAQ